mgnify:CR=1 FL=1
MIESKTYRHRRWWRNDRNTTFECIGRTVNNEGYPPREEGVRERGDTHGGGIRGTMKKFSNDDHARLFAVRHSATIHR